MQEHNRFSATITKVLYIPYTSVALMGAIGLIGVSTGFITYQETDEPSTVSQVLDTALPTMANKVFKSNKYDNSSLTQADSEQDSIFLPDFSQEKSQSKILTPEKSVKPYDNGFASNENLSYEALPQSQLASRQTSSTLENRNRVRSHYNHRLNARTNDNEQTILQMTTPAPLSEQELAERRSRDASLERADQLEQMAISQLEMAQNSHRQRDGAGSTTIIPGNPSNTYSSATPYASDGASSLPPAQVMIANLDEYVEFPRDRQQQNSFFGLKGERKQPEMISAKPVPNAIEAVIHGDADHVTVTNGSTIKLRLLQDIQVGNYLLPSNSLLTGECVISGERIQVLLTSVRVKSSIIPIKMRVYDIDGHAGIYVPNLAVKNQVAQTGAQTITSGSFNMPYMVPSGGSVAEMVVGQTAAQGVNLAINGVRSLAAKKMSQQKATIRPNYRVYLKQD